MNMVCVESYQDKLYLTGKLDPYTGRICEDFVNALYIDEQRFSEDRNRTYKRIIYKRLSCKKVIGRIVTRRSARLLESNVKIYNLTVDKLGWVLPNEAILSFVNIQYLMETDNATLRLIPNLWNSIAIITSRKDKERRREWNQIRENYENKTELSPPALYMY